MNQPLLIRFVSLLALIAVASAQAEGMAQVASNPVLSASGPHDGCTGTVRAASGVLSAAESLTTRVIFHDGSHAPVSVPVTPQGDDALAADDASARPAGGGGAALSLPSGDLGKPRTGPRWQTFLPGSLK